MNMWGYTPSFLAEIESRMAAFLDKALAENPNKGEIIEFNSAIFSAMLSEWNADIKVYPIVEDKKDLLKSINGYNPCNLLVVLSTKKPQFPQ